MKIGSTVISDDDIIRQPDTSVWGGDFTPPRAFEVYGHRLYSNVVADIHSFTETENGNGYVFFYRWNTDTKTRTPSIWPLTRFEQFFCWDSVPARFGKGISSCRS